MYTIEVLLALSSGRLPSALDIPLAEEAERLRHRLPEGTSIEVTHSLEHHRAAAIASGDPLSHLNELLEVGLPPAHARVAITSFDAVLEVNAPDAMEPVVLIDALQGLAGRFFSLIDAQRSAVVVGESHLMINGQGAVRLFYCLRRVPRLNHQEFSDFWRYRLVEHTMKTPRKSGYRQLHADPVLTARAAAAAGCAIADVDGVALEWYPDVEGLWVASLWAGEPHAAVIEAETQMSDFSRALAVLTHVPVP